MSSPARGWSISLAQDAAGVLERMRTTGHTELREFRVSDILWLG
ncbi:hypothetical protein [Streptomyces purpurogeneiscleroticus]|nr:hypothetical protein [Streptomyces purpurogeneiscleroticus]